MSKFDELKEDLQILNYDLNTTHQSMLEMAFVCDFCKNRHECDKHRSCRVNNMDMACDEFEPSEEWEDYCGCHDWWL